MHFHIVLLVILAPKCWSLGYNRKLRSYELQEENGHCIHNLCNATEEYPHDEIEKMVGASTKFSSLFGSVVRPHINLLDKYSFYSENMCATRSITMYPQRGKNVLDMWRTIVNVDGYRQSIAFESCVAGARCFGEHTLPLGYESYCANQFIEIRLVVIDERGELILENFPIPSACACTYISK